jgi:hypothetical protein
MQPGSVYTSVTNAVKPKRPALSLSGKDPRSDSDYDPEQLKIGIEVESEHTDDPEVAAFIARDHLDERKDYYKIVKKAGL